MLQFISYENFNHKTRGVDNWDLTKHGDPTGAYPLRDFWDAFPVGFQDVRFCFQSLEVAGVPHGLSQAL